MVAALLFDETPSGHAEQLDAMRSPVPPIIERVIAIAKCYSPEAEPVFTDDDEREILRKALEAAGDRFSLWHRDELALAMKVLNRDLTGW